MTTALLSQADLADLLGQVWVSYVDEDPLLPAADAGETQWTSTVAVSGAWSGRIVIELSDAAARDVAALMLDVGAATDAEMRDAIGELANIVGGNVKSLMPEPSALTLPEVHEGAVPVDGDLLCSLPLRWHGHPLCVQMIRSEEEPTA